MDSSYWRQCSPDLTTNAAIEKLCEVNPDRIPGDMHAQDQDTIEYKGSFSSSLNRIRETAQRLRKATRRRTEGRRQRRTQAKPSIPRPCAPPCEASDSYSLGSGPEYSRMSSPGLSYALYPESHRRSTWLSARRVVSGGRKDAREARRLVHEGASARPGEGQLTSFNIFTLAVMPSTSVSFCDSSDERTASE